MSSLADALYLQEVYEGAAPAWLPIPEVRYLSATHKLYQERYSVGVQVMLSAGVVSEQLCHYQKELAELYLARSSWGEVKEKGLHQPVSLDPYSVLVLQEAGRLGYRS